MSDTRLMTEESKVVQLVCEACGQVTHSRPGAIEAEPATPCPACGGARQVAGFVDERRSGADRRGMRPAGSPPDKERSWMDRRQD